MGILFRQAIVEVGWAFHQSLVWVKNTLVLGYSDYHYRHEDVLYGWKPGPGRPGRGSHEGSRWQGGNAEDTVMEIDRQSRSVEHPTMKPVELVARALRNSSIRGQVVFDPFAGSGSTLIAAEQEDRLFRGIEIEPNYCDVILARWEAFTGETAVLAGG